MSPGLPRILTPALALALAVAVVACSGRDEPSPATPQASPTAELAPSPTPTRLGPIGEGPTGPGPRPGAPCPVEQNVCDFARGLIPLIEQGDLDTIVALAEPVGATCPAGGLGGPSAALCASAAPGEVRRGYWDAQAGEGLVVTEAEWRRTLTRWFASIRVAEGSDVYGPGKLRIGAISCARNRSDPSGRCGNETIRIHFTFINSPAIDPSQGTGLPGRRVSFHFTAHRSSAGDLRLEGVATVVPPNTVLLPFEVDAVDASGNQFITQYYPWRP